MNLNLSDYMHERPQKQPSGEPCDPLKGRKASDATISQLVPCFISSCLISPSSPIPASLLFQTLHSLMILSSPPLPSSF